MDEFLFKLFKKNFVSISNALYLFECILSLARLTKTFPRSTKTAEVTVSNTAVFTQYFARKRSFFIVTWRFNTGSNTPVDGVLYLIRYGVVITAYSIEHTAVLRPVLKRPVTLRLRFEFQSYTTGYGSYCSTWENAN